MLMRFDPFREIDELWRRTGESAGLAGMPMDAYRRGDEFVAEFDLPGIDPDSVELTIERNVLQVSATRNAPFGQDDEVIVAERPTGSVTRQLFLGGHARQRQRHRLVRRWRADRAYPRRRAGASAEDRRAGRWRREGRRGRQRRLTPASRASATPRISTVCHPEVRRNHDEWRGGWPARGDAG